jgi:hypothetical protein
MLMLMLMLMFMIDYVHVVDASGTAVPGVPYGMMALPNEGGKTVVFVKGIPSEADNNLMSSILSRCGKVPPPPSPLRPSTSTCRAVSLRAEPFFSFCL